MLCPATLVCLVIGSTDEMEPYFIVADGKYPKEELRILPLFFSCPFIWHKCDKRSLAGSEGLLLRHQTLQPGEVCGWNWLECGLTDISLASFCLIPTCFTLITLCCSCSNENALNISRASPEQHLQKNSAVGRGQHL